MARRQEAMEAARMKMQQEQDAITDIYREQRRQVSGETGKIHSERQTDNLRPTEPVIDSVHSKKKRRGGRK